MVRQAQETQELPPALVAILIKIVEGLMQRYYFGIDKEAAVQEFILLVLQKINMVNTEKNPFGYLTTIAANQLKHMRRRQDSYQRIIKNLMKKASAESWV